MASLVQKVFDESDFRINLTLRGKSYNGWTKIKCERMLEHMASHFDIEVTEGWPNPAENWDIHPFDPCTVQIGSNLILTGFVDSYEPSISGEHHTVRITGRSKTEDLIDCMPDIPSGQFKGYDLAQITRALCAPFSIGVVVEADVGLPFPDATILRQETVYHYLNRLCLLRSVLACDDENGRLVLTTAGSTLAAGALVLGKNIQACSGKLDASKRYSSYTIKSMTSETTQNPPIASFPGLDGQGQVQQVVAQQKVVTNYRGTVTDPAVPRYRPYVSIGESALSPALALQRANWKMRYAIARGTSVRVTVPGWLQPNGMPWKVNQLVPANISALKLDATMLIAGTTFLADEQGRRTELLIAPVDAYAPDPSEVKVARQRGKKGRGGGAISFQGLDGGGSS